MNNKINGSLGLPSDKLKNSKEKIISTILDAGLLEEFLNWYRERIGEHIDNVRLSSIDYEILYEFAKKKKILEGEQQDENLPEIEYSEIIQPNEQSRMIKKMRSKNSNSEK
jgi:hypothetical protein